MEIEVTKKVAGVSLGLISLGLLSSPAHAERKVLVPLNPSSVEVEAANKKLVLDFWRDFFNYRKFDEAAAKYLSPNFINHDPYEPSDPKAYADFVRKDLGKLPPIEERPKLFVIAEGDLVIIGEIPREGDPQSKFSANLLRIKDGKIVENWYSGQTVSAPPAGMDVKPLDKTKENKPADKK